MRTENTPDKENITILNFMKEINSNNFFHINIKTTYPAYIYSLTNIISPKEYYFI